MEVITEGIIPHNVIKIMCHFNKQNILKGNYLINKLCHSMNNEDA